MTARLFFIPERARGHRPRLQLHLDRAPVTLRESQYAEGASCGMAEQDCEPDMDRMERAPFLDDEAEAERDENLRNDRYIERALRVSGSLKTAGVTESGG